MNDEVDDSNINNVQSSISTKADETIIEDCIYLAHDLTKEQKRTSDVLKENPHDNSNYIDNICFADLQLSAPVLHGLRDAGFIRPSPVQIKAIPLGRLGMDLIVQAKSGTGKTVVFAVVILEAINVKQSAIQALVLSPTREIAFQSQMVIERLGCHIPGLKCHLFVGGLPLADDLCHLSNCHIVVGTPGRIRYLLESGYLSTEYIRQLILDEADLLLSGGADVKLTGGSANNAFPADINYIWWSLPKGKQVLALSATYTDYLVNEHLPRYMNSPAIIRLAVNDPALIGVRQFFYLIQPATRSPTSVFEAKIKFLCKLLSAIEFQQCLIFSNFHNNAQDLCSALCSRGWPVCYISSSLEQQQRFRTFNKLRLFQCRILITTDLTSRGIDAENVNLVISLEVPWEHETYVHRVGRAGRFGSYGASIIIVSDVGDECDLLKKLQSKCPTQIRELPDPIPSDLAKADFSVELDRLVTVTNRMNDLQPRPVVKNFKKLSTPQQVIESSPSDLSREEEEEEEGEVTGKETERHVSMTKITTTKRKKKGPTNVNCDHTSRNKASQPDNSSPTDDLVVQLSKYTNLMESEYFDSLSSLDPLTWDNKSLRNIEETEKYLVKLVNDYHQNGMDRLINLKRLNNNNNADYSMNKQKASQSHNHNDYDDDDGDDRNHSDIDANNEKLTKNHSKSNELHWTARQISAWYEYHQLLDYANYFYSEWSSAMNEYKHAVDYLKQLRSVKHCTH
ncbi:unnamed protein product [Heterobilharzia americana]|nr:unnamed protein product [Heterobilharzia americana]